MSSAHVIEAVRLAETLASLRGRPLAGLTEVTDATRAVLCDGDERALGFVTEQLVVGQALGAVDPEVPTVPLEADLITTCRTLRVRREPESAAADLDLRRPIDRARSGCSTGCGCSELDWIRPARQRDPGSGHVPRDLGSRAGDRSTRWQLVEARSGGPRSRRRPPPRIDRSANATALCSELTRAVERCLLAELPDALDRLLATLAERAALGRRRRAPDGRPAAAGPSPALRRRTQTDTSALRKVAETLVVRICAGLPRAVGGLDDRQRHRHARPDRSRSAPA